MPLKKSTPPPRQPKPDDAPQAVTKPEKGAGPHQPRPPAPPEVDASRLTPRAVGPFKGGIILDGKGRCAVCHGVGDHVHTRPGLEDHVHTDESADEEG